MPPPDNNSQEFLEEMRRRRELQATSPEAYAKYLEAEAAKLAKPQNFWVRHHILTQHVQLNVVFCLISLGAAFASGWMLHAQMYPKPLKTTVTPEQEKQYTQTMQLHISPPVVKQ
jgi:hypothetical protein